MVVMQIIQDQLNGIPSFFQALYSAVATVTDLSFSAQDCVATGIAEYLDYLIKKKKLGRYLLFTVD